MQSDKVVVYLHLVWTTWDRLPLIAPDKERALHDCIASVADKHRCRVIAIGGMPDHVHLLVRIPSTLQIGFLMQQLKGVSSRAANDELGFAETLKWRGSYAAFSVSRWDVPKIAAYINHQKQHHADGNTIEQLEESASEGASE